MMMVLARNPGANRVGIQQRIRHFSGIDAT
jgi:hypothetical protein